MTDIPGLRRSSFETLGILKAVAVETHLPIETVRLVVDTFLNVVKNAVSNGEKVVVRRFGTFEKKITKAGFGGTILRFKASGEFKAQVKQTGVFVMEKRAVELKEEAVLLAKVTNACPNCKAELEQKDPPKCSNCGTEPFEKKE